MTTESIENLIYLVKNFPKHELASKGSVHYWGHLHE